MRRPYRLFPALTAFLVVAALSACGGDSAEEASAAGARNSDTDTACADEARDVVETFGRALQHVSLLAPDSMLEASLREHYGELVTPDLLVQWTADPALAPGRLTSSPWPHRIEVASMTGDANGCVVQGEVVYATSTDTIGSEALRENVTVRLEQHDGWRISGYEQESGSAGTDNSDDVAAPGAQNGAGNGVSGTSPDENTSQGDAPTPAQAADVIRRYYQAIAAGEHERAYRLWADNGAASGQSLAEFRRGYAQTESVQADVGSPTEPEGAAGSVNVKVPVVVRAVTESGEQQRFEGTYMLRRSNVDGAPAEQRAWRIYDAAISAAPADTRGPDA